jgi:hypothetical protein
VLLYAIYFVFTLLIIIGVLIFLRKIQYDRTHHNLLDLKSDIGGEVRRTSFLQQPLYRGKHKGFDFQISFSNDKIEKERVSYITYSFVRTSKSQLTIGTKTWFAEMGVEIEDQKDILVVNDFVFRSNSAMLLKKMQTDQFVLTKLNELGNFAYMMFSNAGIMFEMKSGQIVVDTDKEQILKILETIDFIARKL